jgi:hypothetical protein
VDTDTHDVDAGQHRAVNESGSDLLELNATADDVDDVDARIHKAAPVPVANKVGCQSRHLGKQARESRIKGEL